MIRLITTLYILFITPIALLALSNPQVSQGTIDLRNWNFEQDGLAQLHGDWDFYWQELLTPNDFTTPNNLNAYQIKVPGKWNVATKKGDTLPSQGFGTYRLLIKVNTNQHLNLKISGVSTAYKIWINNEFAGEIGKVTKSKETYQPRLKPRIFNINPSTDYKQDQSRIIEIVIQVANYKHVNSGIWESVELANMETMTNTNQRANLFTAIILGILFIMALYHFALYFLRRNEYSALFFGVFTLLMAIRGATTDNRLILDLFPHFNFSLLVRLEYLSAYTNIIVASLFFNSLFKNDFNKIIIRTFIILGATISLIIMFTPMQFFTSLRDVYNVFVLLCGIYITFIALVKAMRNKRQNSVMAFIGMFFLFGTGVFDIVSAVANLPFPSTAPLGLVFYVFIQAYILSDRYSSAFMQNITLTEKLNYQNKNLEKIVEERTAELNEQKKVLEESEIQLKENIEELATADEELRQNNEALYLLNKNIEEQKKLIEEKEERLTTIIENQGDGFTIFNTSGEFVFTNPAAEAIFGEEKGQLLGKSLSSFLAPDDVNELVLNSENGIVNKQNTELSIISKNNKKKYLQITITPDHDKNGQLIGSIGVIRDVTKLKKAELKLLTLFKNTKIQKQIIENAHKDITSSINYAKSIQNALLPTPEIAQELLHDHFVLFKPKEAVSGDFFFINKMDDTIVFAAADCTGHGVPGAFMTILSITFLNEIIKREKTIIPSDILEQLRFRIKSIFAQFGSKNQNGLDIALCALNTKTNMLQFSGANNPLYIIRDNQLIEHKASRAPIGNYPKIVHFDNQQIQLQDNDLLYLFSDGYQDQFGSSDGRKFSKKQFRNLLLDIAPLTMNEQKEKLETTMQDWMGKHKQIDDIVIMGIKHKAI